MDVCARDEGPFPSAQSASLIIEPSGEASMAKTWSREEIVHLARETLGVEEDDFVPSEAYVRALTDFLRENPYDYHFILELGDGGAKGGTLGLGVVTCMEDKCWCDLTLGANPNLPDGGKRDGIGSLWEYQVHCSSPKHVQARNERCKAEGYDMAAQERLGSAGGPLRVASPPAASSSSSSAANMPKSHKVKAEPSNAYASSSRVTIDLLSSDEDDDFEVVEPGPLEKLRIQMANEKAEKTRKNKSILADLALGHVETPIKGELSGASTPGPVTPGSPVPINHELERRIANLEKEYNCLLYQIQKKAYKKGTPSHMVVLTRFGQLKAYKEGTLPYVEFNAQLLVYLPHMARHKQAPGLNPVNLQIYIRRRRAEEATPSFNDFKPIPAHVNVLAAPDAKPSIPGLQPYVRPIDPVLGADYSDEEGDADAMAGRFGRYGPGRVPLGAQEMKEFFAKSVEDFKDNHTVEEAMKKLGLKDTNDKIPGMEIVLMAHQIIGVAYMTSQEKIPRYAGGILGDAMGLGKTVQTIATMVVNRSEDRDCKTTLVIAPLALLGQWKEEIENRTVDGTFKVLIHQTKSYKEIRKYDVVLTNGTLSGEWPKPITHKPKKKAIEQRMNDDFVEPDSEFDRDSDNEARTLVKKRGPLFHPSMKFWRVVLDEAHNIRNKNTFAAKAVMELDAEFRWSLTGTLIINSLEDIYSHLHFTGISSQADWNVFRDTIMKLQKHKPKLASKRAQFILNTCMIRRTKDSTINGMPIFTLPAKIINVEEIELTPEERAIYDAVEKRAQVRVNRFFQAGTVMKHYHVVLVLLMRLKQLTCHPWLLRRKAGEVGHHDDLLVGEDDDLMLRLNGGQVQNEVERAKGVVGQEGVDKITKKLEQRAQALLMAGDDGELDECPICYEPFTNEVITPCLHSFCGTCINDVLTTPLRDAVDLNEQQAQRAINHNMRPCPICRAEIEPNMCFKVAAFEPALDDEEEEYEEDEGRGGNESQAEEVSEDDEGGLSVKALGKRKMRHAHEMDRKPKKKGKGKEVAPGLRDIIDELEEAPPLSSKMQRMIEIIEAVEAEDPEQRILVFSQFTSFLDLISQYFTRSGIRHETYVGSMSQNEREAAIKSFTKGKGPTSPKIMLVSLKCGGVGLNLTVANKVINLDLAWNEATERQAWDRAHRIGQTRKVTISRLVVNGSVEQRILEMQAKKQALADGAMGEGEVGKLGRLTVDDLMTLFDINGHRRENEDDE